MSDQGPSNFQSYPGSFPPPPVDASGLTSDDKTWAMLAHIGPIFLGFIAPLVILLTKGEQSQFVKYNATESLNFSITMAIAYVISLVLMLVFIGILTFIATLGAVIAFGIIAGLKANNGETYRYPFALRLVK